tara:strand:+ start:144 stop:347 length:204 start_codon:yes stop_codon:yes gene_type:complete
VEVNFHGIKAFGIYKEKYAVAGAFATFQELQAPGPKVPGFCSSFWLAQNVGSNPGYGVFAESNGNAA